MTLEFDIVHPHPARVYDHILDGKDNFEADRQAAENWVKTDPGAAFSVRANRAFLGRAVRFLAAERGIRQFLDIGAGMPAPGSTLQAAQSAAPGSLVVYADFDPVVLAHLRADADADQEEAVEFVEADLRDPDSVIAGASRHLDFGRPVGLLLLSVLSFIPDEDDPAGLVAAYRDALPPGSYIALSHFTALGDPGDTAAVMSVFAGGQMRLALRPRPAVEGFLAGFTLEPPGLVHPARWRPEHMTEPGAGMLAGIARKPARPRGRPAAEGAARR